MAIEDNAIQEFIASIKPQQYETVNRSSAVVSHVDNEGVVWVNVAGSVIETPTASISSEVNAGDDVTVEWRNNKLYIVGNTSNPSAGSIRVTAVEQAAQVANQAAANAVADAGVARQAAEGAVASATEAAEAAESAQESATNASEYASRALGNLSTVQSVTETLNWITAHGTMTLTDDQALDPTHVYFVVDANGDYVVGNTHYSVVIEPNIADISTYYELSIDESLNNYVGTHLAVTSEGLWLLPDAGGNKVLIATGQGSTYTSAGTYIIGKVNNVDTVLASFLANGAQIGQTGESHLEMDFHSLKMKDKEGNTYVHLSDLREADGTCEIVQTNVLAPDLLMGQVWLQVPAVDTSYTITVNGSSSGFTVKDKSTAMFTIENPSVGDVVVTTYRTASVYAKAYTFGIRGSGSVGIMSVADGRNCVASGGYSHAGGRNCVASGYYSYAEGLDCEAKGTGSRALNVGTIANGTDQTAIGYYNEPDTGYNIFGNDTLLIIGNGSLDNRSNALTVEWDGDVTMALDTNTSSGKDYNLYSAISALGWASDVIV